MKMLVNELRSDGEMQMIFRHFADETVCLERYGLAPILRTVPQVILVGSRALQEGGRETLVKFPAFNFVHFRLGNGWKSFFVVHRSYGTGVRDCVRLAMEAWDRVSATRDQGFGMNAFVWRLPKGAENGVEINGAHLFEAEWMPSNCVAVG